MDLLSKLLQPYTTTPSLKNISLNLKHPTPISVIDDGSLTGEIFHPGDPEEFNWQAGNTSASHLQNIRSLWSNIVEYWRASRSLTGYTAKLQLKAMLVELKNLIDILPAFHNHIVQIPIYDTPGIAPFISLSSKELQEIKGEYKKYNKIKDQSLSKIQSIRNRIGAHIAEPVLSKDISSIATKKKSRAGDREQLTWDEFVDCWKDLQPTTFSEVLSSIQSYIKIAEALSIYEWFRIEKDGGLRTHIPNIGTIQEDGKILTMIMSPEMAERLGIDISQDK